MWVILFDCAWLYFLFYASNLWALIISLCHVSVCHNSHCKSKLVLDKLNFTRWKRKDINLLKKRQARHFLSSQFIVLVTRKGERKLFDLIYVHGYGQALDEFYSAFVKPGRESICSCLCCFFIRFCLDFEIWMHHDLFDACCGRMGLESSSQTAPTDVTGLLEIWWDWEVSLMPSFSIIYSFFSIWLKNFMSHAPIGSIEGHLYYLGYSDVRKLSR